MCQVVDVGKNLNKLKLEPSWAVTQSVTTKNNLEWFQIWGGDKHKTADNQYRGLGHELDGVALHVPAGQPV